MLRSRAWAFGALFSAISVHALAASSAVHAQEATSVGWNAASKTFDFHLAAQPLKTALVKFTRITGLDVVAHGEVTRNLQVSGVSGRMTAEQALDLILWGTKVQYRFTNAATVVLATPDVFASRAQSIALDTITVEGQGQRAGQNESGINGYVATRSSVGTKTNAPIIETPQSVSVVTPQQIRDQKPRNIQEALRYVPGVRTEATGAQTESDSSFQIRGFDQGPSNLFVDGMRLATPSYLGSFSPELFGIERIEVLRGPASILYGQNSPGGIINLVTKRPTENPFHEVEVQGGSFNRKQATIDLGGPLDAEKKLLYRFSALGRDTDTQIDYIPEKRVFVSGGLTWRPTIDTSITFLADHQKTDTIFAAGYPARGTVLFNPNGWIPTNRFLGEPGFDNYSIEKTSIGYLAEHHIGDVWTFRQNLRFSRFDTSSRSVASAGLQANEIFINRRALVRETDADVLTGDNQAQAKFQTGPLAHTFLVGLDYLRADLHRADGNAVIPALNIFNPVYGQSFAIPNLTTGNDQLAKNTGIYFQDQIKLDNKWVFLLGGRKDFAKSDTLNLVTRASAITDDEAFSKRAGFVYLSDIGLAPYISYSESFDPQTGTDRFNQPFKPTTGQQKEAGIKYEPVGVNALITFAAFDLTRQNVTTPDPANTSFSIQTGEIQVRGLEVEAKAGLTDSIDLIATFTRQEAEVTQSNGTDLGKVPTRVPEKMASFWATHKVQSGPLAGLMYGGGVRYIGPTFGDSLNTFVVPEFTLVDAMLSYDVGQARFSLNVANLFDKVHVTGCNSLTNCGYGNRRAITASLRYRW